VVNVLVSAYVEDGLACRPPCGDSRGIKEGGKRTANCSQWSASHDCRRIGVPSGVAIDVVNALVCAYIEDGLARRLPGGYSSGINETGKRTSGRREWRAGHGRGIVMMPGRVAVQVVYVLVRSYVEDRLAGGCSCRHSRRVKET